MAGTSTRCSSGFKGVPRGAELLRAAIVKFRPDRLPWFPFYAQDFYARTVDMSPTERGVYIQLLAASWFKNGLPQDSAALERIVPGARKNLEILLKDRV